MLRNSLQHVARGADGVLFFQWRASRAGAEKFHSALVPHAGTDTRVWREVVELGAVLGAARRGRPAAAARADVAHRLDWEAWWAGELDSHPSVDAALPRPPHAPARRAVRRRASPSTSCTRTPISTGYRLVLVPTLYLVTDAGGRDARAASPAGTALVTYFSGIVDEHDHVRLGGYPGAFRELLGVRVEEFARCWRVSRCALDDGSAAPTCGPRPAPGAAPRRSRYVDGRCPACPP